MPDLLVRQLITVALGDNDEPSDEEILESAKACSSAAMAIIDTIESDAVFEAAIAPFPAAAQEAHRQVRAQVRLLSDAADAMGDCDTAVH
jgi:hypothetical protein